MEKDEEYFVIDTDCGSDDALAIMLAVNYIHSEINTNKKLLGIVCCSGNTTVNNVARNVLLTLNIMNENNVKVYKGSHCSLLKKYDSCEYYGEDGLGNSVSCYDPTDCEVDVENGVLAMISLVRKYPKKVTILCLGPLTNFALAYMIDSQFFELTKQLYVLGGNINGVGNVTRTAEFNFYYDPEAADITLKNASNVCPITIIPWECCQNHYFRWDMYKKLTEIQTNKALFFKQITKLIVAKLETNAEGIVLGDFLAASVYFYPKLVLESNKWPAAIELNGDLTRGQLIVDKSQENAFGFTFVTKIDEEILLKIFEAMLR